MKAFKLVLSSILRLSWINECFSLLYDLVRKGVLTAVGSVAQSALSFWNPWTYTGQTLNSAPPWHPIVLQGEFNTYLGKNSKTCRE